jgi:hypothetical protein
MSEVESAGWLQAPTSSAMETATISLFIIYSNPITMQGCVFFSGAAETAIYNVTGYTSTNTGIQ